MFPTEQVRQALMVLASVLVDAGLAYLVKRFGKK